VLSCSKQQEFQVAEAIHCPSCSTRYRLRPERLKPVIRRAKCLSCGGIFPVGDIVARLLALPTQGATAGFAVGDLDAIQHAPLPAPQVPSPSLTLGDLEDADAEILEKTLVEIPTFLPEAKAPITPEPPPPAPAVFAPSFPPEITETTLSGYTSARDAIDKLFGSAPAAVTGLKVNQESSAMDLEATLSALDSTLGQTLPPGPGADHTAADRLTDEDLSDPSRSTMRLSQEDLLAVLAAAPKAAEPTVALRPSDLVTVPEEPTEFLQVTPAPRSLAPAESPDGGAEMLRLKIGEEIYSGLTMPQLIAWVEEGRILENHTVARQHSENWLEAHKVPGLRPVFERLRRERSGGAPSLDSGISDSASKKSLFSGLFGKN
jgi:hypothetical protein